MNVEQHNSSRAQTSRCPLYPLLSPRPLAFLLPVGASSSRLWCISRAAGDKCRPRHDNFSRR